MQVLFILFSAAGAGLWFGYNIGRNTGWDEERIADADEEHIKRLVAEVKRLSQIVEMTARIINSQSGDR